MKFSSGRAGQWSPHQRTIGACGMIGLDHSTPDHTFGPRRIWRRILVWTALVLLLLLLLVCGIAL
jgi:hypothetical protein